MDQANTIIRRSQLYVEVWSRPISLLAPGYGVSDVGLAKLCSDYDIPRPPRGYWAKLKAGHKSPQIPLPVPAHDPDITIRRRPQVSTLASAEYEQVEDKPIVVAEDLHGSHPLVSRANKLLQKKNTDEKGLLYQRNNDTLYLRVGKDSLRRALLIMDAFIKALEERNYPVVEGPRVKIQGLNIGFSIIEHTEVINRKRKSSDHDEADVFYLNRYSEKRQPSGKLSLRIDEVYWADGCRKTWSDGKKQRLEGMLNKVVKGMVEVAVCENLQRAEAERRDEAYRVQERKRAEQRRHELEEAARLDDLILQSENWRKSQLVRAYIEARKEAYLSNYTTIEASSGFADWLIWAKQKANALDPLSAENAKCD